jgi:hypothetical protein
MFHIRGMPEAGRIANEAFLVREICCHLPEEISPLTETIIAELR